MFGQWIGPYSGTNQGLMVADLDDGASHYRGTAFALESDPNLPPTYASLRSIPKDQAQFSLRVPLFPIDRRTGVACTWEEIKQHFPSTATMAKVADTVWKVGENKIELSWTTDTNTFGSAELLRSSSTQPSALTPLSDVTNWEEFRRFARQLEAFRYVFRGQTSNQWRLRTSFHRTRRSSLITTWRRTSPRFSAT